jgi:hypothetical protein
MRKYLGHIAILSLILLSVSCSESVGPIDNQAEPVFYFQGTVDGDSVEIIAGRNDYFMATHCTPRDSFPRAYRSHLRQLDCPNCGPRIDLEWINLDHYPGVSADTALQAGYIMVNGLTIFPLNPRHKVFYPQFSPSFGMGNVSNILWDFGNGATSTAISPSYEFPPGGPDTVQVGCTITYTNGCSQQISIPVNLDQHLQPNIFMMHSAGSHGVSFELLNYSFDQVEWDFGDGHTDIGHQVDHNYNSPGVYEVEVRVKDPSGGQVIATHRSKIKLGMGPGCGASFQYHSQPIQNLQLRFGQLSYISSQNKLYKTKNFNNVAGDFVELLDHRYYKKNLNGQEVYVCEFNADLWLYSQGPGNDSIYLNGKMFLGVAHTE